MKKPRYIIYVLYHDSYNYLYVGRSSKGLMRPREHGQRWALAKKGHFPVSQWIIKLRKNGFDYDIAILEEHLTDATLNDAEKFYVAYFKYLGFALLNCTEGGDGISGHKFSAETKARMSITRKGRTLSESAKEKLRIANLGKKMSADAIARTVAVHKGKKRSEITKLRLSESHRGKQLTKQQKTKIGRATKQRWDKWREEKFLDITSSVLRAWRQELNLSQAAAAKLIGVSKTAVRDFEKRSILVPHMRINLLRSA